MRQLKSLILGMSILILMVGCGSGGNTQSSADDTLRIACVGDSITEGYGLQNPSAESYPAQLAGLVAEGASVQNDGIGGRTVIKAGELSYWNSSTYQNSLSNNPDIVVIMLGTNDMQDVNFAHRDDIVGDYKALIESYKSLSSNPTIYICLPPPSYGSVKGITNDKIVGVLLPKLREVAAQNSVQLIDIYSLLSNKKELFPDTLHPNAEGARQIAQEVYGAIY